MRGNEEKMTWKKITSMFLSIIVMLPVFTPISYAEREPTITPYWIVTNSVNSDLEITKSGKAEISTYIVAAKADKVKL